MVPAFERRSQRAAYANVVARRRSDAQKRASVGLPQEGKVGREEVAADRREIAAYYFQPVLFRGNAHAPAKTVEPFDRHVWRAYRACKRGERTRPHCGDVAYVALHELCAREFGRGVGRKVPAQNDGVACKQDVFFQGLRKHEGAVVARPEWGRQIGCRAEFCAHARNQAFFAQAADRSDCRKRFHKIKITAMFAALKSECATIGETSEPDFS